MFVNPTFDSNSMFSSPRRSAVEDTPRETDRDICYGPAARVSGDNICDSEQATNQADRRINATRPVEGQGGQREQGDEVKMGAALSQKLQGVMAGVKATAGHKLRPRYVSNLPDKALQILPSGSEQQCSLPIRAVRGGNNSISSNAAQHTSNVESQLSEVHGQCPLLERFLSAAEPKHGTVDASGSPDDSLTPTAQPIMSPSKPDAEQAPAASGSSNQAVTEVDETPRTWALLTHEHVASLSHSISFAHDPRTRATASVSNTSSPGVTQRPRNQPAPPALYTSALQPASGHNTASPYDTMSSPSQLLVPIDAVNHLAALAEYPEGEPAPTFALTQPHTASAGQCRNFSPGKQHSAALQHRLLISPSKSPSKALWQHATLRHLNKPFAVPSLPVPLPYQEVSQGPPTAPSPGWTLAPSEWTVDDRTGGGSMMDGLSGVISRSSSTKVSSAGASNPTSSPAALPLRLRYGATPSPEGEWEHAYMSGDPTPEGSFPLSDMSPDSSESMLSPAEYAPVIDAVSSMHSTPSRNAGAARTASEVRGVSGSLRKRFGGIFDNSKDLRSSHASVRTGATADESAATAQSPQSSGNLTSSPQISPLSEAVLREHSACMPPVREEHGSPHATGRTSDLTSPNKLSSISSQRDYHYAPARPHSPMLLPDNPTPIDPTNSHQNAMVADPFPADAFAGALRMCVVSSSNPEDSMLLGGALELSQCVPASRTNSAIPSSTSKATSPEDSGEADKGKAAAAGAQPPAVPSHLGKTKPLNTYGATAKTRNAVQPATAAAVRGKQAAASAGSNAERSSGISGKTSHTAARSSVGPAINSNRAARSGMVRTAGGPLQRRSNLGTPQPQVNSPGLKAHTNQTATKAPASGAAAPTKTPAARRRAQAEVRGIPVPPRAGTKSPGPSVNLQKANMRLQETLNLSTNPSGAGSGGDASPASVPHTPAPTSTTHSSPTAKSRWAAHKAAPPDPSLLGGARTSTEASRKKTSRMSFSSGASAAAATKRAANPRQGSASQTRATRPQPFAPHRHSAEAVSSSKDGAAASSALTVSDAEVTVDAQAPEHACSVSPGLPGCRIVPYCESAQSRCSHGGGGPSATTNGGSMGAGSVANEQEQIPANMQDISPPLHGARSHDRQNKLPEGSGTENAPFETPPHASSCSNVVTEPTTCPSTVDLVPVTDTGECISCMTDADATPESAEVSPEMNVRYPAPQTTCSASPAAEGLRDDVPEISPVLPLIGPAASCTSSVASAEVPQPRKFEESDDGAPADAAPTLQSASAARNKPAAQGRSMAAAGSARVLGTVGKPWGKSDSHGIGAPGAGQFMQARPVHDSAQSAQHAAQRGGGLVDPPVLPRGSSMGAGSLSLGGPHMFAEDGGTLVGSAADAALIIASPLLMPVALESIIDARHGAACGPAVYGDDEHPHGKENIDVSAPNSFQDLPMNGNGGGFASLDKEQDWDICNGEMTEKRLSDIATSGNLIPTPESFEADDLDDEFAAQHACRVLESPAVSAASTSAPAGAARAPQSGMGASTAAAAQPQTSRAQGAIDRGAFTSDQHLQVQLQSTHASASANAQGTPGAALSPCGDVLLRLECEESAASAPTPVSIGGDKAGAAGLEHGTPHAHPCTLDALAPVDALEVQITNIVCASTTASLPDSGLPSAALPSSHARNPAPVTVAQALEEQRAPASSHVLAVTVPHTDDVAPAGGKTGRALVSPAVVEIPKDNVSDRVSAESGWQYGESENLDNYSGHGSATPYNSVRAVFACEGAVPSDSDKGSGCTDGSARRSALRGVVSATGAADVCGKAQEHIDVWEAAESQLQSMEGSEGQEQPGGGAAAVNSTGRCGSVKAAVGLEDATLQATHTGGVSVGPGAIFDSCGCDAQGTCAQHAEASGRFPAGGLSVKIADVSENPIPMQSPEVLGAVGGSPRLSPRRLSHGTGCRHVFVPSVNSDDDVSLASSGMSTFEAAKYGVGATDLQGGAPSGVTEGGVGGIGSGLELGKSMGVPALLSVVTLDRAMMNSSPGPPSARTLVSPNVPHVPDTKVAASISAVPEESTPQASSHVEGCEDCGSVEVMGRAHDEMHGEHAPVDVAAAGTQATVDLNMHTCGHQQQQEKDAERGNEECSTGDLTGFIAGAGTSGRLGLFDTATTQLSGMQATPPASPGGAISRSASGMLSPAGISMHLKSRGGILSTTGVAAAAEAAAMEAAAAAAHFVPPKLAVEDSFSREYEETWNEAMAGLGDALQEAAGAAAARAERKRLKLERRLSGFGYSGPSGTSARLIDGSHAGSMGGASPHDRRLSLGPASFLSGDAPGGSGRGALPGMNTPPSVSTGGAAMLATPSTPSSDTQGYAPHLMASGDLGSAGASHGAHVVGACMSAPLAAGEYSFGPAMSEGGLSRATTGEIGRSGVSTSVAAAEVSGTSLAGSSSLTQTQSAGKLKCMKKNIKASFKKMFTRKKPGSSSLSQAASTTQLG